jgi:hypothetical protein
MSNEQSKTMRVRFAAVPLDSSPPSKTTTISAVRDDEKISVVCAIGDSCATSVISTLLDSSNG